MTAGKWIFYPSTGLKVDHLWSVIAKGVVQGRLGGYAKVSPYVPDDDNAMYDYKHIIMTYNDDFTEEEQVMDLEHSIRCLGIKAQLSYKPDAYSRIGIYRNNKWRISATIYRSDFKVPENLSKIYRSGRL